jgi:hypothetical protein
VSATPHLLAYVAENARQGDIDELYASNLATPADALEYGAKHGNCFVALADERPICAFGIVPYSVLNGIGIPWMVGTVDLDRYAMGFIRRCRTDLKGFFGEWAILVNVVDARNEKGIRWLSWLGFTIHSAVPYGPFKIPFHPFSMEVRHV